MEAFSRREMKNMTIEKYTKKTKKKMRQTGMKWEVSSRIGTQGRCCMIEFSKPLLVAWDSPRVVKC